MIRDGKIYLTLRDAIDLALEDNLDMVIARYNLPIAQLDVLRTSAGAPARGVNTGVVSGTPGGAGRPVSTGAGLRALEQAAPPVALVGAGAGAGGLGGRDIIGVGRTNVSGASIRSFPLQDTPMVDHTTQLLANQVVYGVPLIHLNTVTANLSYSQAFPTGGSIQATFNNNRQTTNSPNNNAFNPQYTSCGSNLCPTTIAWLVFGFRTAICAFCASQKTQAR